MDTFVLAWVMLLLFALFNNYVVYRLLKQRGRTDLMWVSVVATVVPIALFAFWPNAFTLMAFPLIQSIGLLVVMRMVQQQS
ncbi:hypothetical protein [uncultured Meiothermus sp.]|jgi:RsiW-degrading membrane proteinase PrsW (M82 family)|uniref:hypothetical protein n=1 Tax=uncultured Meiothermus sp. TaxID=157471 RepID=UPI00262763D1|nr:hypothetical protein [uncultured Meiothermus sp.]